MAIGDAVAGMTTRLLGLEKSDFAMFHPGGSLGKRLLLRVSDIMGAGADMPVTKAGARIRDALFDITSKGYGATIVVDNDGKLAGIFTDGDLRRFMECNGVTGLDMPVGSVMTKTPRIIAPERLAVEALRMLEEFEISVLLAVDGDKPVGILRLHDILKAGVA